MSSGRKILLLVFVIVSIVGMWARYQYSKSERLKRENLLRTLANISRESERKALETPKHEIVDEPRDMFDSDLPRECFDQIKGAVGQDFKLLEIYFHEKLVSAQVSTDGKTAREYRRFKNRRTLDGPIQVRLTGDGKLEDNLFTPADVNVALIPKIAKEAKEKTALPDSKITAAKFSYAFLRYEGEGPEWTISVETEKDGKWDHKYVMFDANGKFKKVL